MTKLSKELYNNISDPIEQDKLQNVGLDLKSIVSKILETKISPRAKDIFLNSRIIKNTISSSPDKIFTEGDSFFQRSDINKFFLEALFMYRSFTGGSILEVLPYLSLDGKSDVWLHLFEEFVVDFLIKNNVLDYYRDYK